MRAKESTSRAYASRSSFASRVRLAKVSARSELDCFRACHSASATRESVSSLRFARPHVNAPSALEAFFQARTFPTMLGVLLPASTSARMRVVPGGRAKGETRAEVKGEVQRSLNKGERIDRSTCAVSCATYQNGFGGEETANAPLLTRSTLAGLRGTRLRTAGTPDSPTPLH